MKTGTAAGDEVDHQLAQTTLARMLFDPEFARAVRLAPSTVGVGPALAAMLGAVDERALRADPLRRRRALGAIVEEFRHSTAIVVAEKRSLAFLEGYFASQQFHVAMQQRASLALGFGAFLEAACADGRLTTPRLVDVARLEAMQARARREEAAFAPDPNARRVRLAPGVVYGRLGADALDTIARIERYQLELSIVPQAALCEDAPRLELPPLSDGIAPLDLLVVPTPSGLSLVTLDEEMATVLAPLESVRAAGMQRAELAHVAVQHGLARDRAEALIAELLDDEVLAPA